MIFRILLFILFIILISFILFFIYNFFIPAVKNQISKNRDPLFSEIEIDFIETNNEPEIKSTSKRAVVLCNSERDYSNLRLEYKGIKSCKLFTSVYETQTDCPLGCVGFGDCIKICPQNAIVLKNNTAIVTSNCCGCGKCVESCPKNLIKLFDKNIIKNNEKITLCNATSDCITKCNKFLSTEKIVIPEKKHFKFWKSCYKMFKGK